MLKKFTVCLIIINIILLNSGGFVLRIFAGDPDIPAPVTGTVIISNSSLNAAGYVPAGSTFRGSVTVTNNSAVRVENVEVKSSASNARVNIESFSTQVIGALEPGQSSTVNFTYRAASAADSGETQIEFVAYADTVRHDSNQLTVNIIGESAKQESYFDILTDIYPSTITTTEVFKIGFRFIVRGGSAANVKVEWSASEAFEPNSPKSRTFPLMQSHSSEYVEFEINLTDKITTGSHTVTINITGNNAAALNYAIDIFVERGAGDTGQGIKVISTEIPDSAKTGDKFQIKSTIQNTGAAVREIIVELKRPNEGIAHNSLAKIQIPILERGEQRELIFDLSVTDKAIENYNQFELIISHGSISNTYYTGLNITADASSHDIKIVSVNIPRTAKAGEEFQLKADVANEGSGEVKNIKITLQPPTGITNRSSPIITIASLARDGRREITFDLRAADTAAANYYQFELIIEYNDIKKSQFEGLNITRDDEEPPSDFIITADLPNNIKHTTDFKLSFTVKNNGGDAKNLIFSVPNPDGIVNKSINSFLVPELKSGESVIREITFSAKEEAAGKYCLFAISVTSKDADGKDIASSTQYAGIAVDRIEEKTEFQPDLSIDYINIPHATGIERDFNVEMKLINSGAEALNITLTLEPQAGLINKSSNIVKFDSIPQGGSNTGRFSFMATETAVNGFNAINIKIEYSYKKADGTTVNGETIMQYSGLLVSNPKKADEPEKDDSKKDMPVVIISRFDYGGEEVYGGKAFNFELDLMNTHRNDIVKDLKITLSQEKGIFTPKSGSNTFFVEQLSPGGITGQSIEMIVKTDALPDSYGLTVTLEYKNGSGESTVATEIINVPVQQEIRFHIGEVPFISEVEFGDEAYVNIQFGNLGRSTIFNVNLRAESENFFDPDGGHLAGNLEAGNSGNKAFYLTPTTPGMAMGKIVFTYENAIGEQFIDEVDISFMVMGGDDMGDFGFEGRDIWTDDGEPMIIGYDDEGMPIFAMSDEFPEESQGFFGWLLTDMGFLQWLVIGGAALIVIAVIVIIIIAVRRKRDKIKDDDEDL